MTVLVLCVVPVVVENSVQKKKKIALVYCDYVRDSFFFF